MSTSSSARYRSTYFSNQQQAATSGERRDRCECRRGQSKIEFCDVEGLLKILAASGL